MKAQALHITYRLWALLFMVGLCACDPWEQPEEETVVSLTIFKEFWGQMDQHYTCFAEHPVNWDSVYYTHINQVAEMQDPDELIPILQSIVNTLKDPQIAIISHGDKPYIHYFPRGYDPNDGRKDPRIPTAGTDYALYNENWAHNIHTFSFSHKRENKDYHFLYIEARNFKKGGAINYHMRLDSLISSSSDCQGIIVDLRGNYTGEIEMMMEFARQFYEGDSPFIQTARRESKDDRREMTSLKPLSVIGTGTIPNDIPIVVLVNYLTFGPANICAYILQAQKNVIVIGLMPSSGGGSSVSGVTLTHNWRLHFSNDVKYYVNRRSCEYPIPLNVVVNESGVIEEQFEIDGQKQHLYLSAPFATAINLLESLSQE